MDIGGTLTRREQVPKLTARLLTEVIWAAAILTELAIAMDFPAPVEAETTANL